MRKGLKQLWKCPRCGRRFANKNQWHSCGRFSVKDHLDGKSPRVVSLYKRFHDLLRRIGPLRVVPTKTRIGFQARMTFADAVIRKDWLDAYVILSRRVEHPRFTRIQSISPRCHVHFFRIHSLDELDGEVSRWMREAYKVGEQKHLLR